MSDGDIYLIWSNEHEGWWAPGHRGYSKGLAGAGRYTRKAALDICRQAIPMAGLLGRISEIPVRQRDVSDFMAGVGVIPVAIIGDKNEGR